MVAVVTDSAANVPPELAGELGLRVVPMYLTLGDRQYRDGVDIVGQDFYERLVRGEVARTATPSPHDFLEAYRATGQDEVVCVTVASAVSAINHEARMAAEGFEGRVEVIDSGNASMGEGFVAVEAARLAAAGAALDEVAARAKVVADAARLVATIDTFEFLRRSGRVSKLQAYAATMLDIKPVFRLWHGEIAPVARPRTRSRALQRIVSETLRQVGGRPVHLAAFHANAEEDARSILDRIAERAAVREAVVTQFTPAMGAHTGPGLVGTAFWCEE